MTLEGIKAFVIREAGLTVPTNQADMKWVDAVEHAATQLAENRRLPVREYGALMREIGRVQWALGALTIIAINEDAAIDEDACRDIVQEWIEL